MSTKSLKTEGNDIGVVNVVHWNDALILQGREMFLETYCNSIWPRGSTYQRQEILQVVFTAMLESLQESSEHELLSVLDGCRIVCKLAPGVELGIEVAKCISPSAHFTRTWSATTLHGGQSQVTVEIQYTNLCFPSFAGLAGIAGS
jgi:hypothetical protein